MNIQQLQMTYSNPQDRLILRINSQAGDEVCLFLTRKIVISFLDILTQSIQHSHNQQSTLNEAATPPQHTANNDKLPASDPPLLVEKITINTFENNLSTLIFFADNEKTTIRFNLNLQILHHLSDLLHKILPVAEWNITPINPTQVIPHEHKGKPSLH